MFSDSDPTPPLKILDQKMYIGFPDRKPGKFKKNKFRLLYPVNRELFKKLDKKSFNVGFDETIRFKRHASWTMCDLHS